MKQSLNKQTVEVNLELPVNILTSLRVLSENLNMDMDELINMILANKLEKEKTRSRK